MVYGWGSEWFQSYLGLKELVGSEHASVSAFGPRISNFNFSCKTKYQYLSYHCFQNNPFSFKTLWHNFTSISTMSRIFRTIRQVVTKISAMQNLDRKKKRKRKKKKIRRRRRRRRRRNEAKTMRRSTSFWRLNNTCDPQKKHSIGTASKIFFT